MKRLLLAVLAIGAAVVVSAQAPADDPEIKAMRDELERSKRLTLNNLQAPYFVQYLIDESDAFSVSATMGGLITKRRERRREPDTMVRVGDYKFDSSNYMGPSGFGSRYDLSRFPLENSYPVIRRYLWLQTDSLYKSAVETLSRKHAAVRNLMQGEQLNDFAHAEPVKQIHNFQKLTIDEDAWANRVRALSAVFAEYPGVANSSVELESAAGGYTLVNSEGTEVRQPENVTYLRVRAIAQAPDGMMMRDAVMFHALHPQHLPSDAEMTRSIRTVAENVTALAKAPRGEDYSGPVLFEGMAGAQILAEVLGRNVGLTRRPVADSGRGVGVQSSELEGRIGARVLPDSFEVVDDPTQKEWHGRPLFGTYEVDREGVAARPLRLIEKGALKGYLLTRQPVRGFEGSNGRARLPGNYGTNMAALSNMFVNTSDGLPPAELKKKLIELCQTRGKPYGILIRKMDFPSTASVDEMRRLLTANQGGRPVSLPILAYKVYLDGREELVRALRFRGLNVRSFKDILAAGIDAAPFDYMENSAPFAMVGGARFTVPASVIAPSLLIDDLELHPAEDELPKLPIVPAPEITNR